MNCSNFMEAIRNSDFVRSQIPMQMQLGIPYINVKGNRISLVFAPHAEIYSDKKIEIYEKRFELEVNYPSCHIVKFVDLTYDKGEPDIIKVADTKWMIGEGKYLLERIFCECSETLRFFDEHKTLPNVVIKKYNDKFSKTVKLLGISDLYEVMA